MRGKLHTLVFVGMILGVVVGLALSRVAPGSALRENGLWLADLFGRTLFVGALKMIVAPLILFSILAAITSLGSRGELFRLGGRALGFYISTTSIAVAIGLVLVLAIGPGHRGNREELRASWTERSAEIESEFTSTTKKVESAKTQTTGDTIKANIEKIVVNPFKALADGQTLGVIFFAVLLGAALIAIGDLGKPVVDLIEGANAAIMRLTGWIMAGSPFFIFCLITGLIGEHGTAVFESLAWYSATVIAGIAIHVCVLLAIVALLGRMSPLRFLAGLRKAWVIALSPRSTAATLPATLECVTAAVGVTPRVAGFILPLGATVNMDGTALYEGVAVIFLIQLFGGMPGAEHLALTPTITVVIFLTAVLASIGAAAVPDAGLVTMVLVANAVGLPVEYIPMIFAVDAFLDMFRTSTNVMGDAAGAVVLERLEMRAGQSAHTPMGPG